MTGPVDRVLLQSYLGDHLAGAVGGSARFARMADAYARTPLGPALARVARQVADERDWLRETAHRLGVQPSVLKRVGIAVTERVGRLKPNGRLVRRSPLSDLVEVEAGLDALHAKAAGWAALRAVPGLDATVDLDDLERRAEGQVARIGAVHATVAAAVL